MRCSICGAQSVLSAGHRLVHHLGFAAGQSRPLLSVPISRPFRATASRILNTGRANLPEGLLAGSPGSVCGIRAADAGGVQLGSYRTGFGWRVREVDVDRGLRDELIPAARRASLRDGFAGTISPVIDCGGAPGAGGGVVPRWPTRAICRVRS